MLTQEAAYLEQWRQSPLADGHADDERLMQMECEEEDEASAAAAGGGEHSAGGEI